jgi:hypothetical protein
MPGPNFKWVFPFKRPEVLRMNKATVRKKVASEILSTVTLSSSRCQRFQRLFSSFPKAFADAGITSYVVAHPPKPTHS